ncbi:hypothetical protein HAX54_020106 [Datura stramonium]|uniref:Uncharacterized protein n=1 Tax=Datura stramonium TaxID=4076 RepID=A0ABS8USQ4_DATST|nr:hypothetical protein [Datura stramonium]
MPSPCANPTRDRDPLTTGSRPGLARPKTQLETQDSNSDSRPDPKSHRPPSEIPTPDSRPIPTRRPTRGRHFKGWDQLSSKSGQLRSDPEVIEGLGLDVRSGLGSS